MRRLTPRVCIICFLGFLTAFSAMTEAAQHKNRKSTVWAVFFMSRDCAKCEAAKELIEVLQLRYPLRVKRYDISKESDYAVFRAMEAIHSDKGFFVPLILVGDKILTGEHEILDNLESTVKNLHLAGGTARPYIGPVDKKAFHSPVKTDTAECPTCSKGRPPSASEELHKVKSLLDKIF
ncbi:hypothetical protein [Desulfomonile tiedjei]|uniref:Glutaredoxin n=1 Tax=Desulfomonile tiedjei (strain ATCC 49306 / DSM 6799 / DCB-1) TaxID=706587 RepID=I4CDG2_DESTA|nr:hypothetical protein [Desulfomonile tiedjei]AFM27603.1 hypothetical protein Desti_4991 [Desulfomonile tiedjei DSM 6799]